MWDRVGHELPKEEGGEMVNGGFGEREGWSSTGFCGHISPLVEIHDEDTDQEAAERGKTGAVVSWGEGAGEPVRLEGGLGPRRRHPSLELMHH